MTLYIDLKECANGKTILFLCVGRKFTHDSSSALRLYRVHPRWCKIFHRQNVFAEDFTRVETIVDYYLVTSNFCGQK